MLVVEDSPGDVNLIKKAFEKTPTRTEVHVVNTVEDALDFLRGSGGYEDVPRPNLVLLDLHLPVRSGKEFLEEISSDPALRSIPVVVFTSSEDESDIEDVYELGANVYLTKPASFDVLVEKVRGLEGFWHRIARASDKDRE